MDKKENDRDTEFVKDDDRTMRKYIFQKNTITRIAVIIIIAFLILLIIGLSVSGVSFFDTTD